MLLGNETIENLCSKIQEIDDGKDRRIKYLEKENKELKDEHYKNSEMQIMKEQLDRMRKDYYRGFPISDKEDDAIKEWCNKHDVEAHGLNTLDKKLKAGGCIGGRYSYKFVPTSIGVSGSIVCSCGASFEFQEIG